MSPPEQRLMQTPASTTEAGPACTISPSGSRQWLIPATVAMAFLMESIDSTVLTTSIPAMARDLHRSPLALHLAITVYTLSLAVFIPMSGWIADRFGMRRVFTSALGVFLLGSIACAFAPDFPSLIAARVLQGIGGAMTTPVGRLILVRSFAKQDLAAAMSFMVTPVLIGPLVGPLIGGAITTYLTWRWIFLINIPTGLIGIALALRFVANERGTHRRPFDLVGFLLIMAAMGCLQFSVENFAHALVGPFARFCMAVAIPACLLIYWATSRRKSHPALDLSLFDVRAFRIGVLAGSLCRIGMNGQPFLLPLLFQLGFGLSALQSGGLTFVSAFGGLFTRPLMVPILRRFGFRALMRIMPFFGAALVSSCALLSKETPHLVIMAYLVFSSMISSILFNAQNMLVYAEVPSTQAGGAVSIAAVAQQLSMSLGISIAAILLTALGTTEVPAVTTFHHVFIAMSVIVLLSLPLYWRLWHEDGIDVSQWRGLAAQRD